MLENAYELYLVIILAKPSLYLMKYLIKNDLIIYLSIVFIDYNVLFIIKLNYGITIIVSSVLTADFYMLLKIIY